MKTDQLANYSRIMATLTLVLISIMFLLNLACWVFPNITLGNGLGFSLAATNTLEHLNVDVAQMPWWQITGAIVLSSIPLIVLAQGLNALRQLFQSYGAGYYFSPESAGQLRKVGQGVALWVLLSFCLEPIMSLWLTMLQPAGQRTITLSFEASQVVALFLAASVMIIARILGSASALAEENQQFV